MSPKKWVGNGIGRVAAALSLGGRSPDSGCQGHHSIGQIRHSLITIVCAGGLRPGSTELRFSRAHLAASPVHTGIPP